MTRSHSTWGAEWCDGRIWTAEVCDRAVLALRFEIRQTNAHPASCTVFDVRRRGGAMLRSACRQQNDGSDRADVSWCSFGLALTRAMPKTHSGGTEAAAQEGCASCSYFACPSTTRQQGRSYHWCWRSWRTMAKTPEHVPVGRLSMAIWLGTQISETKVTGRPERSACLIGGRISGLIGGFECSSGAQQ
ncbi:hypothetical protein MRB53_039474 [Persea americana]|nr:hypothetical protein MRB53_039474 [Persea americana]